MSLCEAKNQQKEGPNLDFVSTWLFKLPSKEGSDTKGVQSQKGTKVLQANIQFPNASQSALLFFQPCGILLTNPNIKGSKNVVGLGMYMTIILDLTT